MNNLTAANLIKEMIQKWREEYSQIKDILIVKGAESSSNEYNLLATEALRLSECMNDAADLLIELSEKES